MLFEDFLTSYIEDMETGRTIYMLILLLNTWCYTKVDMRYGPVIDTAAYVFVLLLSHFILKEKITKGKIMGNLIIIAGILIYTL